MTGTFYKGRRQSASLCVDRLSTRRRVIAAGVAIAFLPMVTSVRANPIVGIQGTMSNFDVFNETGSNAYGAEIDLEGLHVADVTKTYPAHFSNFTATDYTTGSTFGTRLVFTGYNFTAQGYLIPRVGQTTNGHYAVNQPGAEHFGFAVRAQPTNTSYYWLGSASQKLTSASMSIPQPTWSFVPAAAGAAPIIQAVLAPPPPPPAVLYPDAVWVKTYVTELTRQVDLIELISAPAGPDQIAPQLPSQVEAEWELLPGDMKLPEPDISLSDSTQAVLRRYEFYQYIGTYDEVHLPNSTFTGGTPDPLELGQFIAANMVAANLDVPEPASAMVVLLGAGIIMARHRKVRA